MSRARPHPKHRAPRSHSGRRSLRRAAVPAALALSATAVAVSAGLATEPATDDKPDAAALTAELTQVRTVDADARSRLDAERTATLSRSADRRSAVDPAKTRVPERRSESGGRVTRSKDLGAGDPRATARAMLGQFGFSANQFSCLDALWTKESGWNVHADNPTSSAYGIPQALPGSKMSTAGADWATNAATQIRWGLGYIDAVYGSPCAAWSHSQSYNWY